MDANICRAAVAGETNHTVILQPLGLRTRQDTAHYRGRSGEGRDDAVHKEGHMGVNKADGRHAVGRDYGDGPFAQHLQRQADRQSRAAAAAGLVPVKQFFIRNRLCIKRHKYPSSN